MPSNRMRGKDRERERERKKKEREREERGERESCNAMSYFIANALKTDSRDCHLTECRERERERERDRERE